MVDTRSSVTIMSTRCLVSGLECYGVFQWTGDRDVLSSPRILVNSALGQVGPGHVSRVNSALYMIAYMYSTCKSVKYVVLSSALLI